MYMYALHVLRLNLRYYGYLYSNMTKHKKITEKVCQVASVEIMLNLSLISSYSSLKLKKLHCDLVISYKVSYLFEFCLLCILYVIVHTNSA